MLSHDDSWTLTDFTSLFPGDFEWVRSSLPSSKNPVGWLLKGQRSGIRGRRGGSFSLSPVSGEDCFHHELTPIECSEECWEETLNAWDCTVPWDQAHERDPCVPGCRVCFLVTDIKGMPRLAFVLCLAACLFWVQQRDRNSSCYKAIA